MRINVVPLVAALLVALVVSMAPVDHVLPLATSAPFSPPSSTIAISGFAACNKHDHDQQYWSVIDNVLSHNGTFQPHGFAWLGDAIYADELIETQPGHKTWTAVPPEKMQAKFQEFRHSHHYSRFRRSLRNEPTGVWDDHDMGINDADRHFPNRGESQQAYLDFLGVPDSSRRRQREGVFHVDALRLSSLDSLQMGYQFSICSVLLDARSWRDSTDIDTPDILGEDQWTWLEALLVDPTSELGPDTLDPVTARSLFDRCAVTVIGSGIQILGDEKPTEHWGLYPGSRNRLMSLLRRHNARRFALLSGDVHYADLQMEQVPGLHEPVVELTSSGLTHSLADVGLDESTFDWLNFSPRRVGRFLGRSFGSIEVTTTAAILRVHDVSNGRTVLQHTINIGTNDALTAALSRHGDNNSMTSSDEWHCGIHNGRAKVLFRAMDIASRFCSSCSLDLKTKHWVAESIARGFRIVSRALERFRSFLARGCGV